VPSIWKDAQRGEGQWTPVSYGFLKPMRGLPAGAKPPAYFYRTVIRPDPDRPYSELVLVAMDMRQPAQVLRKLNEAMIHQQLDDRFCTLTYTRVVPSAQGVRLSVCRGGHPAPLVLRASGEVEEIGTPGSLIGVLPDVRLWEETTQLQPGDAFVAYTDGVTEARRNREQFGEERLIDTLAGCVGLDADAIGERIESAVLSFGGPEPSDDLAILVLRVPA
jgi:serine phosphatase RsbU (regulator of sigma subunit)